MGHVLARQQQFDLFDAFAEAGHRLIRRAAEAAKLVRQEGAGKADIEAPSPETFPTKASDNTSKWITSPWPTITFPIRVSHLS